MSDNAITADAAALNVRVTDRLWFNALWFQSVWFCAVLGRESLLPVTLALIALHVWLVEDRRGELRQLAAVGGLGVAADALLSAAGVYEFAGGVLLPLWLVCLWMAFAAVLGRSLAWLSGRPAVAALAGMVVFPLNYWAGQRFGAVEFGYSLPATVAVLAVTWGVLLPQMYGLTKRLTLPLERGPS